MADRLTSRERVLAAFDHTEPDRVPAWLGASPAFRAKAVRELGLSDDESLSYAVGDDFRRVYARYAGPDEFSPDKNLPPGVTYRSVFGILRHGYEGGQPLFHPLAKAETVADVDAYPWPDPAWMDVSQIRADAQRWGGQYAMLGGEWAPFWHDAIDLLGMENLLMKMFDAPEVVEAVLAHTAAFYAAVSERTFEAAGDAIDIFFIGNDFGSRNGPLIGVKQFEQFLLPPLRSLIDLGHRYNMRVLMHCCGGFAPLIPSLIDAGLDGLQALQPNCRGMDPAALKAEFGRDLLLMGAINTQLLIEGTPEQARAETRRILEIMMPGGGYVACPSHDYVLGETPVDNIMAVYETIRAYGDYG
ncbi:MAG TPA: uroporphyrinogen decarboxylase family protein [Aggregatilinea sp.]|uniref:uroporphyrinogen decarboxylase family protein n=1 Tax=Aggregatilinea sp. TaxID=2806333 RepID=UPI002BEE7F8B|nr:uroporphyrinogen decarboxylase family protein [Aggregatilinea sp.]HML20637.1 uroporphyrinogen decarboxylase family protein [Aggregatilinea sp.]